MEDKVSLSIAAMGIAGIVLLEMFALSRGINGTALSASMAGIGVCVGVVGKIGGDRIKARRRKGR